MQWRCNGVNTPGADAETNPAAMGTAGEAWRLVTASRLQGPRITMV